MIKIFAYGANDFVHQFPKLDSPCHKCGDDLEEESAKKFHTLKNSFLNVIPANDRRCTTGTGNGWKTSGQNKRGIRGRGQKRKAVLMNLDLKKFRPRSIGETPESLANWLADSRPAWNQLIATLRIKRQSKKQKQAKWLLDDDNWVILCVLNSYNMCWPKMPPEGRRFFSRRKFSTFIFDQNKNTGLYVLF